MAEQGEYEPLTGREREILALIRQELSDREIAAQLFVEVSTIKWFNRQIFRKLGVENRKQAIQRVAELRLLETPGMPDAAALKHNLPAALTPFIGRSEELADVRRLLSHPHTRLVTILAPGGMGKTRLALEAAEALLNQYADGAFFVALAGMTSPNHIVPAVAEALGAQFVPDGRTPIQQLADVLRRKHLLLVLDNFEHLLDAAPLVADLLAAAPQVKVLATSREKLNLTGEVVYALTGIEYPENDSDPLRYGAVQLFIECALRANPQFDGHDVDNIARICRLVQGMPLAIELAAAWAGMLSAADIAAEIERSADFLKTSMRDIPERQRSIRAVFEAAWARLDEDTRRAFRWMSVFRGGCTREAAQTVTGALLATLAALVDKALLRRNPYTERYDVHELLRQYAEAELEKAGETEAARQAHQNYYASFMEAWGPLLVNRAKEAVTAIEADLENIRLAFARAAERGIPAEIEPFAELAVYFDRNGMSDELLNSFQVAIDGLEPHDSIALGRLLIGIGLGFLRQSKIAEMRDANRRAMTILERLGESALLAKAMVRYGAALSSLNQPDDAERAVREGLRLAEEAGDRPTMALAMQTLGNMAMWLRQFEQAKAYLTEAIRRCRELGNIHGVCHNLIGLGKIALVANDFEEAERIFTETKALAESIGYRYLIDGTTFMLGEVASARGDWEAVHRLSNDLWQYHLVAGQSKEVLVSLAFQLARAAIMLGHTGEVRRIITETLPLMDDAMWAAFILNWRVIAGRYLAALEEFEAAALFLGSVDEQLDSIDLLDVDRHIWRETYEACRDALPAEEFAAAVERGKTLTPEAAIAELLPFLQ